MLVGLGLLLINRDIDVNDDMRYIWQQCTGEKLIFDNIFLFFIIIYEVLIYYHYYCYYNILRILIYYAFRKNKLQY